MPSNIAEGQARYSRREFHHFLNSARGSLAEVETQIMLANDLGHLGSKDADTLLLKTSDQGRILNGLIASTKSVARSQYSVSSTRYSVQVENAARCSSWTE